MQQSLGKDSAATFKDSIKHLVKSPEELEWIVYVAGQPYDENLAKFKLKCLIARSANKTLCEKHRILWSEFMTPQEELFKQLFSHEKHLVKDMNDIELIAHREELSKIAYEARARLTATDDEVRERKAKNSKKTGFITSVMTDDVTSDAINKINARQKKIDKTEKLIEGLVKLGMSRADAEKTVSAGNILAKFKDKVDNIKAQVAVPQIQVTESKPVVNPFAKKD